MMPNLVPKPVLLHPSGANNDAEMVELWLMSRRSALTRKGYRASWERFKAWSAGLALSRVTSKHLESYKLYLAQTVKEASSRNTYLYQIKSLLTYAYDLGYLGFNPGRAVEPEPAPHSIAEYVVPASGISAIIAAESVGKYKAAMTVLYYTACRSAELLGIRWCDFGQLEDGERVLTIQGKGGKSRVVPVDSKAIAAVKWYCENLGPIAKVFQFSYSALYAHCAAAGAKCGFDSFSPHCFRHSRISHLAQMGIPATRLRDLAGHSNIAVTDVYLHTAPKALPDTLGD